MYSSYYRHIVKAERVGERDVRFTFDSPGNRELPLITGQLNVLPKHWWEGTDAQGRKRDVSRRPRWRCRWDRGRIASRNLSPAARWCWSGSRIIGARTCRRASARTISTSCAMNSSATTSSAARLSRPISSTGTPSAAPRNGRWPTIFAAVHDKRVIKELFPVRSSGRMQGWAFNLRRPLFTDVRLRRAFNLAFDFEEMNRPLSTGEYHRDSSYFDGIPDFMASGLPEGQELKILEPVRDKVPAGGFHDAVQGSGRRQSGNGAQQSARSDAAVEGGRLRNPRPQAGRSRRKAGQRRDSCVPMRATSGSRCSTSRLWNGSASP